MTQVDVILAIIGILGTMFALLTYVIKKTLPSVPHLLKTIEEQHAYTAKLTENFQKTVDEGHAVQRELSENIAKNTQSQDRLTAMIREIVPKHKRK